MILYETQTKAMLSCAIQTCVYCPLLDENVILIQDFFKLWKSSCSFVEGGVKEPVHENTIHSAMHASNDFLD